MATSTPPSDAILSWATPPQALSEDGPLSKALQYIESVSQSGSVLAPMMPSPEALHAAALKAGIAPRAALAAYLAILDYE
ncbi:MAG: hypothetical protein HQL35_03105 [Alphaproteobacteria bacterium]|nr:hypothetical protein [Alphaproteobacteria bacterium]